MHSSLGCADLPFHHPQVWKFGFISGGIRTPTSFTVHRSLCACLPERMWQNLSDSRAVFRTNRTALLCSQGPGLSAAHNHSPVHARHCPRHPAGNLSVRSSLLLSPQKREDTGPERLRNMPEATADVTRPGIQTWASCLPAELWVSR